MNDIYSALANHLANAIITDIDTATDVAWVNANFDPTGKSAWLATSFMPTGRGTATKDTVGIYDDGIFQVDVFVPVGSYASKANTIAGDVLDAFLVNSTISYNGVKLTINDSTFAAPQLSEAWYQIPISINYTRI